MGGENSKLNYRKAVIQLTTKTEPVDPNNNEFWDQFWNEYETTIQDIFILIPAAEIRALREESPTNLSILCSKAIQKIIHLAESSCLTAKEQHTILNCVRMLTRIIPYIFEDSEWNSFFWFPFNQQCESSEVQDKTPVAEQLMNCISNLLFYPDFTVSSLKKSGPDNPEDSQFINSCDYIWENGVGFSGSLGSTSSQDSNRTELLKLLLTCFSVTMYMRPDQGHNEPNPWIAYFTSRNNKHCLPLFTSLLNVVFSYDPVGYGMPYNHLMFSDYREPLVEVAIQILCITLETSSESSNQSKSTQSLVENGKNKDEEYSKDETNSIDDENSTEEAKSTTSNSQYEGPENFFINFMSRIHKDHDFDFILRGFSRLLNNPLSHTYLPNSMKKIQFHQELLILFWRMCEINKNFMFHVLKGDHLMEILVPILYHLNDARCDPARLGVMHIGVFILLLLSGERNFGVKLNKVYQHRVNIDVPVFTGTHADLLVLVFHKIITTGHTRLQPLYDCFLTVIVNVSPYLKSLSMVSATKILHLIEAFSSPWFLFSSPTNHHLIFFLLEVLNNIIQYQFDGNSNIIYSMIRKRQIFHDLSSLKADSASISQALSKKSKRAAKIAVMIPAPVSRNSPSGSFYTPQTPNSPISQRSASIESSSQINSDVETGQLKASLEITPSLQFTIDKSRSNLRRTPTTSTSDDTFNSKVQQCVGDEWIPNPEWAQSWKQKLPLQTIMRLLQVLVPQVEKICIDKGLTDESEIIKFLQRGTLVGLLPVPHPILIRKYQSNPGTDKWFRTYMWGVIYLRNIDPPIWYDTNIQLFEIQRVTGSN